MHCHILEEKIGLYCSYCEMPITHVPEVEHMISRKHGGNWIAWSNLLLGCKYCNSRKDAKTTLENVKEYLRPDADNTAVAFSHAISFQRTIKFLVFSSSMPFSVRLAFNSARITSRSCFPFRYSRPLALSLTSDYIIIY